MTYQGWARIFGSDHWQRPSRHFDTPRAAWGWTNDIIRQAANTVWEVKVVECEGKIEELVK